MDVHWWGGLFSQNMGLEVCLNMGAIMLYRLCIRIRTAGCWPDECSIFATVLRSLRIRQKLPQVKV